LTPHEEEQAMAEPASMTITREQLYALVWKTPLRQLAPTVGYSDVGLAKACRKMNVPLPGRGYWAKKAAGKGVRRAPLRPLRANDHETPRELGPKPEAAPQGKPTETPPLPAPVAEQVKFESAPKNSIRVVDSLRSAHPLVLTAREVLRRSAKAPADFVHNWQVPHLEIDVSKATFTRALRIMNAAVKAFEKRGWQVAVGPKDDRGTFVTVLGQKVSFGIREPRKQVANEPAKPERLYDGDWYTPYQPKYREEPSGRLSLVVRRSWGRAVEKSISDAGTRTLENRVNEFMVLVVKVAHERAERERSRIESELRRREAEQVRLVEQRKRDVEAARIAALKEQAERWRRSRTLADYLAAVRVHMASVRVDDAQARELEAWLDWAEGQARIMDPLSGSLEALCDVPRLLR
jgi:hypothetical protein